MSRPKQRKEQLEGCWGNGEKGDGIYTIERFGPIVGTN